MGPPTLRRQAHGSQPTGPTPANPTPPEQQPQPTPARPGKRGRTLGFILLGIGVLVLANVFNIDQYVFPLLLIGAGAMLLRKR